MGSSKGMNKEKLWAVMKSPIVIRNCYNCAFYGQCGDGTYDDPGCTIGAGMRCNVYGGAEKMWEWSETNE